MRQLILASASPRRKELLALLGLPFEVVPSAYEERLPESHEDPAGLATHLACEKAVEVSSRHPDAVVIGADTIVVLACPGALESGGTRVFGKPGSAAEAAAMLRALSGRTHQVVTGVALAIDGRQERSFATSTDVTFRELTDGEIETYVATGEPMDKAGAYAIQGRGAVLIQGIRGDYPNVVGLPLTPLALTLRDLPP